MKKQIVSMVLFGLMGCVNTATALSLQDIFVIVKARIFANTFRVCRRNKTGIYDRDNIFSAKKFKKVARDYDNPDHVDEVLLKSAMRNGIDLEYKHTLRSDQVKKLTTVNEILKNSEKNYTENENIEVGNARIALTSNNNKNQYTRPSVVEARSHFIFFSPKTLEQAEKFESDIKNGSATVDQKVEAIARLPIISSSFVESLNEDKDEQEKLKAYTEYSRYKHYAYNKEKASFYGLKISPCTICSAYRWGLDCTTKVSADAAIKIGTDLVDELKKQ